MHDWRCPDCHKKIISLDYPKLHICKPEDCHKAHKEWQRIRQRRKVRRFLRSLRRYKEDALYWLYYTVYNETYLWFYYSWPYRKIRNIKRGLRNYWRWRKVIWNDNDWDERSLLQLMATKFTQMERCNRKFDSYKVRPQIIKQLQTCKNLAQRLVDIDYIPWHLYCPELQNWKGTGLMIHKMRQSCGTAIDYEEYMDKQDRDLLFKLMRKHLRKWEN